MSASMDGSSDPGLTVVLAGPGVPELTQPLIQTAKAAATAQVAQAQGSVKTRDQIHQSSRGMRRKME